MQINIIVLQQNEMFSMYIFYCFFINHSCMIYNGIEPHNFMTQAHIKIIKLGYHTESLLCLFDHCDKQINSWYTH